MPRTTKTGVLNSTPLKKTNRGRSVKGVSSVTEKNRCGSARAVASDEQCFWVNNGPILRDINDLFRALDAMTDAQFKHHVSRGKNDFALWVEHVLAHGACAKRLAQAKTRVAAKKALASCCASC